MNMSLRPTPLHVALITAAGKRAFSFPDGLKSELEKLLTGRHGRFEVRFLRHSKGGPHRKGLKLGTVNEADRLQNFTYQPGGNDTCVSYTLTFPEEIRDPVGFGKQLRAAFLAKQQSAKHDAKGEKAKQLPEPIAAAVAAPPILEPLTPEAAHRVLLAVLPKLRRAIALRERKQTLQARIDGIDRKLDQLNAELGTQRLEEALQP